MEKPLHGAFHVTGLQATTSEQAPMITISSISSQCFSAPDQFRPPSSSTSTSSSTSALPPPSSVSSSLTTVSSIPTSSLSLSSDTAEDPCVAHESGSSGGGGSSTSTSNSSSTSCPSSSSSGNTAASFEHLSFASTSNPMDTTCLPDEATQTKTTTACEGGHCCEASESSHEIASSCSVLSGQNPPTKGQANQIAKPSRKSPSAAAKKRKRNTSGFSELARRVITANASNTNNNSRPPVPLHRRGRPKAQQQQQQQQQQQPKQQQGRAESTFVKKLQRDQQHDVNNNDIPRCASPQSPDDEEGSSEISTCTVSSTPSVYRSYHVYNKTFWIDSTRYQPLDTIGHGAFGTVCSALDIVSGKKVAIKRVEFDEAVNESLLTEIMMLKHFQNHPNIIGIRDVFIPAQDHLSIYMVMDLMDTDLNAIIKTNQVITSEHVQYFMHQLLHGLASIHSAGVIHRDLKPANILLNANCDMKICDFGLACAWKPHMMDYVVTRWYRAPELLMESTHYTPAIDIWSAGCIFAELLLRRPLFPGRNTTDQLIKILDIVGTPSTETLKKIGSRRAQDYVEMLNPRPKKDFRTLFPRLPSCNSPPSSSVPSSQGSHDCCVSYAGEDDCSSGGIDDESTDEADCSGSSSGMSTAAGTEPSHEAALDLLERMLSFDPDQRPSAMECLNHPYFRSFPPEQPVHVGKFQGLTLGDDRGTETTKALICKLFCIELTPTTRFLRKRTTTIQSSTTTTTQGSHVLGTTTTIKASLKQEIRCMESVDSNNNDDDDVGFVDRAREEAEADDEEVEEEMVEIPYEYQQDQAGNLVVGLRSSSSSMSTSCASSDIIASESELEGLVEAVKQEQEPNHRGMAPPPPPHQQQQQHPTAARENSTGVVVQDSVAITQQQQQQPDANNLHNNIRPTRKKIRYM